MIVLANVVTATQIVHAGSGVTLETEVSWCHQAAALYKMASKQHARCGGTSCSAINCTNRRFMCPGKSFSFPKDKAW